MNNITDYRNNIDNAMKKVKNNSDYFANFGDLYVPIKIKEYLDNIYDEMEKVRALVIDKEDDFVELEPNIDNS